MTRHGYVQLLVAAGLALHPSICSAQTPPTSVTAPPPVAGAPAAAPTPEKPENIKTGVIASSVKTGAYAAIDVDTSGASPGDEQNVISGSISRSGQDRCVATVSNSGEKTYSVTFAVVGTTSSGSKVVNSTFSATIKPKGSVERQVSRCASDLNLSVVLKSAKALK